MPIIDLHTHSNYSDGTLPPKGLVEAASERGITVLALTDHDTMAGTPELTSSAQEYGIRTITGIELSTHQQGHAIHVLGYGLDPKSVALQGTLGQIQEARQRRNEKIFRQLQRLGFNLSLEPLQKTATGQIGRPHIAKLLVEEGIVRNEQEAFARFLRQGAAAYIQREILPVTTAIDAIKEAGGLAVLAHPGSIAISETYLASLIKGLTESGLAGVEVFHPLHSKKIIKHLEKMCANLNLIGTGGSDFHGRGRDRAKLGEYAYNKSIPIEILQRLEGLITVNS